MLPYLAQGANSSLEDGAVLGLLLGHMTKKTQLPGILRLYESLRKSRGEAIVRETFKQVKQPALIQARFKLLLTYSYSDMISTCMMEKSSRSEMKSSFLSLAKSLRVLFPVDGHVQRFSLGCMDTMLSRKLRRR